MRQTIGLLIPILLAAASPAAGQADRAEKAEVSKKTQEAWSFNWDAHPSLRIGKGTRVDFRARLQGELQASEAFLPDDGDGDPTADIARRRIGIEGEILDLFDYQVERELEASADPWRDVFVNYRQFRIAQVQAGKFKLPFSLDENTGASNLDFVYRSLAATLLAPGRDRGVMLHGRVPKMLNGAIAYEVGMFSNDGSNARGKSGDRVHGDRTVAGRVTVQPWRSRKSPMSDLALGVAFTRSALREGFPDVRGRTAFDQRFYRPNFWVNGNRRRLGVEARWRPGPFSLKSEYIRLEDDRRGMSVEDGDLSPLVATGWYVSGTWAITGERKARGLDTPRRPLLFVKRGYGAVELAARVERVHFGSGAGSSEPASFGTRADVVVGNSNRATTVGVNWYVNRWVKVQMNLIHESIADPGQGPMPSQPSFWSRAIRFQFSM